MATFTGTTGYTVQASGGFAGTTAYTVTSRNALLFQGTTDYTVLDGTVYRLWRRRGSTLVKVQLGRRRGSVIDWQTPDLP